VEMATQDARASCQHGPVFSGRSTLKMFPADRRDDYKGMLSNRDRQTI